MNCVSVSPTHNFPEAITAVHVRTSGRLLVRSSADRIDPVEDNVEAYGVLLDINRLPLQDRIETTPNGGLRIGALVTNAGTASDLEVKRRYPLLSKAILADTSLPMSDVATAEGNLLQRTRCYYFYDPIEPHPKWLSSGLIGSVTNNHGRIHSLLGSSERGIEVNPSDMCVALAALDAVIHVEGSAGSRLIPIAGFHRSPGEIPGGAANLDADELIVAVELPPNNFADHSCYLKMEERDSDANAAVSVAAALEISAGKIVDVRVALGGVAPTPWRDPSVEAAMIGRPATPGNFSEAARLLVQAVGGFELSPFKIELAQRAIVRALVSALSGEGLT